MAAPQLAGQLRSTLLFYHFKMSIIFIIKICNDHQSINENYFLSERSLFWRVKCDDDQHHRHHSVVSLESIFLSSGKSNQGSKKKTKNIRISLRIHWAAFPTAGMTVNAWKRGKRVVVSVAGTHKIWGQFCSLGTEIEQIIDRFWTQITTKAHSHI